MKENYLGTSVPPELWKTYQDLAIKQGKTLENLVTAALYDYLEKTPPTDSESALLKEVSDLKEKVKNLEELQGQFNRLNLTVHILENKLEYLLAHQTNVEKIQDIPPVVNHDPKPSDFNEDDYDEPDEVLWDFVPE